MCYALVFFFHLRLPLGACRAGIWGWTTDSLVQCSASTTEKSKINSHKFLDQNKAGMQLWEKLHYLFCGPSRRPNVA